MNGPPQSNPKSAFSEHGLKTTVKALIEEVQEYYLADTVPWVVGYSGGKDSTATLQLIWLAMAQLPTEKRRRTVHVITTDTLVENPVIAAWVDKSLDQMTEEAHQQSLPIRPHKLVPDLKDRFWVNLIGKGYPAPRPKFRWCTERLKIKPVDAFISSVVHQNGEAIVVLGTRRAESSVRAGRIDKASGSDTRRGFSPHSSLPGASVYAPIVDWSNDDVWMFLMQVKNPWRFSNKDLLTMYQGATADGECPLVIDTSTPSCGDSRFGCWVCTLVEEDKSMSAMVLNDDDKRWMEPLLTLRNRMDEHDHDKRDFRRITGNVQLINFGGKDDEGLEERLARVRGAGAIPGPYTQNSREEWLRSVLKAQQAVREHPKTPGNVKEIELISIDELQEIRRIWLIEKHEIEDNLPQIYEEIIGTEFPAAPINESQPFGHEEMAILKDLCDDELLFQLCRELLEVERGFRSMSKRVRLYDRLESAFRKSFFDGAGEGRDRAARKKMIDLGAEALMTGEADDPVELERMIDRISGASQ